MAERVITSAEILEWNPCGPYSSDHISELMGDSITAQALRDLDIPAQDRLWVLAHAMTTASQLLLSAAIAERILTAESITDEQALRLVAFVRGHARGEPAFAEHLQDELRIAQLSANKQSPWHHLQGVWAASLIKSLEEGIARTAVWLAVKSDALGHPNAFDAALDDAVSLLEAE